MSTPIRLDCPYCQRRGTTSKALKPGIKRDCSTMTGLSHHAALALCSVPVVLARPWACDSRSMSSAIRPVMWA